MFFEVKKMSGKKILSEKKIEKRICKKWKLLKIAQAAHKSHWAGVLP